MDDDEIDQVRADAERECARLLGTLEAALHDTLDVCMPSEDSPRFTSFLHVSALLRLASRLILEADADDRGRYVEMVEEVARRVAPWATASERHH